MFRTSSAIRRSSLEYLVAEPSSYCLVISRKGSRIVSLAGKERIETLVAAYLHAVGSKEQATAEARELYGILLSPILEAGRNEHLVVVRDGPLHLVPFEALADAEGRHVAEGHTVSYAPSATSLVLLAQGKPRTRKPSRTLLGVGGVPYDPRELEQRGATRDGYDLHRLANLPSSEDEVLVAQDALSDAGNTVFLGSGATEAAFKRADPSRYRIIHLAVHGVSNTLYPHRAALVLLSDPKVGEDGFLQAAEIVQMPISAELGL